VIALLGGAGSGKTEIALNLALNWVQHLPAGPDGRQAVHLVDFDFVTPYFRCQDVRQELGHRGIRVVASPPEYANIDVPVMPFELSAVLASSHARTIFDVGGDEIGAATLSQFNPALKAAQAGVYLVVNSRRPGTRDVPSTVALARKLSQACRLPLAGLIANGNLGPQTTPDVFAEGLALAQQASEELGTQLALACCLEELAAQVACPTGVPLLPLEVQLRPPWNV